MKFIQALCFFLLPTFIFSQQPIHGIIKDKVTNEGIPYAAIGIPKTQLGTLSDANGSFELFIPENNDSIKISAIGYDATSFQIKGLDKQQIFYIAPKAYDLAEVKVKPKNIGYLTLGTSNYSKDICTAFMGKDNNWKGEQAAIRANNKEGRTVFIESFNFYIIKNDYEDSLQFRIMFYNIDSKGNPGATFLQKPILFKTNTQHGEVHVDLKGFGISTTGDFFMSIECLEEKIESAKFCFAGSIRVPSYFKTSAFSKWGKVKGGGGDFNVKVSYTK